MPTTYREGRVIVHDSAVCPPDDQPVPPAVVISAPEAPVTAVEVPLPSPSAEAVPLLETPAAPVKPKKKGR